jgi:hypothetical protein
VLSENVSITGRPATVLTENKLPVNESVTENNCPEEPWMSTTVDPDLCTVKAAELVEAEPEIANEPVILAEVLTSN